MPMIRHSERSDAATTVRTAASTVALALCTLVVTACSGGGGSGPSLGSGQGPDPATVDFALGYVKRTLPTDLMAMQLEDNAKVLRTFNVDADLYSEIVPPPSARAQHHSARHRRYRAMGCARRRGFVRRHETGVRDARTVRRECR